MNTQEYYRSEYWEVLKDAPPRYRNETVKSNIILRYLSSSDAVLDVGCGDGTSYGHLVRQSCTTYIGLDLSMLALDRACRVGIRSICANVERQLPFPRDTFDVVICMEVLEHLFAPEALLCELHRILRSGGVLLVSVPNVAHLSNRIRLLGGRFVAGGHPDTADTPWRDPHIRFFTVRSLQSLLTGCNFELIGTYGVQTALLTSLPIISVTLAQAFGRERVRAWSKHFEGLGRWWPGLFAGHLVGVAKRSMKANEDQSGQGG